MQPQASTAPMPQSQDLAQHLSAISETALQPATTPADIAAKLRQTYTALYDIDFSNFDTDQLRREAPQLMAAAFDMQSQLRQKIRHWNALNFIDGEVETALRNVFRASRYMIDLLGENLIGYQRLGEGETTHRGFSGDDSNSFVTSEISHAGRVPFRSGDVILVRGRAHNSAAIARIGDIDSQFSHVLMVYADPNERLWSVESLIEEDGGIIMPLAQSLEHGLGRAVLFRHPDAALAQRAAYIMHDRVRQSLDGKIPKIRYDFSMRLDDSKNLFCSKLIRRAFREASDGRVLLPTFPTKLSATNRDFLDRIGVKATETFAPGDLELEPGFDLIAEWQDYRVTSDLRIQDLVMDKLFEWMEQHNYRFKETMLIRLISIFGRAASYLSPTLKDLLAEVLPKVPSNMSRRAVAAIAMLHKTAQPLLEELQELERQQIAKVGRPLHPRQILKHLEALRDNAAGNDIGYLRRCKR